MIQRYLFHSWIILFLISTCINAQLDLAGLTTNTVKQNQPWAQIETQINSVKLELTVNKGLVIADVEIAFTPDSALIQDRTRRFPDGIETIYKRQFLDSLETSSWFQLEPNYALTELYLWVGDEKVRGELQERALASAQYESIVERRKDPALLETWGGGSYSLRIFPLETGQKRKIEVRFVCGMENEEDGFQVDIPIINSLRYIYNSQSGSTENFRSIGSFSITARSLDGSNYLLDWPGIGKININGTAQILSHKNISEIGRGTVSDLSKSNVQSAWIGGSNFLGGMSFPYNAFGTKSILIYDELDLEPEPEIKIFLLDVPSTDKKALDRAKKLALLSVKNYLKEEDLYNIGLVNSHGSVNWVLTQDKPLNPNNLAKIFDALQNWNGSPVSHSLTTMEKYVSAAIPGSKTIIFHINGQAYNQYPVPYPQHTNNWPKDSILYAQWNEGYQAWNKIQQDRIKALSAQLDKANLMLFGFWNDYPLSQVAQATGGYQLGNLSGYYYWYSPVITSTIDDPKAPNAQNLYLPPLFGPDRPGNQGPQNLEVSSSGVPVIDLGVLYQNMYPYYFMRGGLWEDDISILRSDMIYPYYWRTDSAEIRVSGRYMVGGLLNLKITGTWAGLGFSKSISLSLPALISGSNSTSSLWAYQRSEKLRLDDYLGNIEAVKALGRDYHVVNSQMSLLALEPGMELWTEMPNPEQDANNEREGIDVLITDSQYIKSQTQMNLDSISLDDILNSTSLEYPIPGKLNRSLTVTTGETVSFLVSGVSGTEVIGIEVTDLNGKSTARIKGTHTSSGYQALWNPQNRTKGIYFAIARLGGNQLVKKFVIKE